MIKASRRQGFPGKGIKPHVQFALHALANVPAVLLGETVTRIVPLKYVRIRVAVLFAPIGVGVVLSALGIL